MSIYKGTTLIASGLPVAGFPLFYHTFQDHVLNNSSWLRADTFSWQSGAVYVSAYNHLVDDISGITAETETISGTTITFYRATDGHKIVLADQESNVSSIYTATGVAWYYILDTTNTRFKLPRSQWNFVGLRDNAGNYVAESLPNIKGTAGYFRSGTWASDGALVSSSATVHVAASGWTTDNLNAKIDFDASLSSSAYQDNAPVQQRATQAYLYFYVGNTVQDQTTVDIGEITDALNGKVDLPTNKTQADVDFVVESYQSGTSWYRVYKSGWCEQGGQTAAIVGGSYTTTTFLKEFPGTDYSIQITSVGAYTAQPEANSCVTVKTASNFTMSSGAVATSPYSWVACGYVA